MTYVPSCDGGAMTLFHLAIRVPIIGASSAVILAGTCLFVYPALLVPSATEATPDYVAVVCEHGGLSEKIMVTDDSGKRRLEDWCALELGELPRVEPYVDSVQIANPQVY